MAMNPAQERQLQLQVSHIKKGLVWGLLSGLTWGLDGVILGIALGLAPFTGGTSLYAAPLAGSALHDGWAGLWLFFINLFNGKWREYGRTLATKPGIIICLAALFGGPIGMSGYILGINMAGASYALPITACYPAISCIMAMIILKEKITPRIWAGIVICLIGAIVVSYSPPSGNYPHFYLGIALSLLACLGWGMESVLSTFGMDMVDPDIAIGIREATSFFVYLVGVLPLVAGFAVFGAAFGKISLWYIAVAGLLGGLSYLCWYRGLNMTGVARTMALNITYALWGVLFGWLIAHTPITPTLLIGALIITFGTLLCVANPKELVDLRSN